MTNIMVIIYHSIKRLFVFVFVIGVFINLVGLHFLLGEFKEELITGRNPDRLSLKRKVIFVFDGEEDKEDERKVESEIGEQPREVFDEFEENSKNTKNHFKRDTLKEVNLQLEINENIKNDFNKEGTAEQISTLGNGQSKTHYDHYGVEKKSMFALPSKISTSSTTKSTASTTKSTASTTKSTASTTKSTTSTTATTTTTTTTTTTSTKSTTATTPTTTTTTSTSTTTTAPATTTTLPETTEGSLQHSQKLQQRQKQQKCKLPSLDPFHPDIRKYIKDNWRGKAKCGIKRKAKILSGGKLHLELKNVQRAGFYYIRRVNDFEVTLSKWHPLKLDRNNIMLEEDAAGCLRLFQGNRLVIPRPEDSPSTSSRDRLGHCPKSRAVKFTKDGRIIHVESNQCLTFSNSTLKFTSSKKVCSIGQSSKFKVQPCGTIKHVQSQRCVHRKSADTLTLDKCDVYTSRFFMDIAANGNETMEKDLNVTIPLEEDFILIDIIQNHLSTSEFHMYPVRRQSVTVKKRKDDGKPQLNVIMLMSDSVSRSDAQRYLKETYGTLENDPDSFILKGHTINGDGTTPQLCTMLVGKQEHELPEARRGYPHAAPIDRWNFIFKDFRERGYVTLFSEDEAWVNAFHYRLHGFKDPPADKYVRPWWLAVARYIWENKRGSASCDFELGLAYLKDFLHEYKDEPTFSYTISSALTHSEPARVGLVDSDINRFLGSLKETGYSNNSIVIVHGDHGNRLSAFRTSIQGKLEERLPFVSVTVPPWFKTAYPSLYRNLRANADVLTTYYDIYSTFKHILSGLDEGKSPSIHEYGTSLFSDIVKMNRTCKQAGIDEHWCPCLTFTEVNVLDSIVQTMSVKMVDSINERLLKYNNSKEQCSQLHVDRVLRASKTLPNSKVQQYEKTLRSSSCDNCDIKLNSNFTATKIKYEIVFRVLPSNAVFEASGEFNTDTKRITLNDNISRLNMYGNQPDCIAQELPYLRPFCFCKNVG